MTVDARTPLSGTMDVDEFMAVMEMRPKGERRDLIVGVAAMMSPASQPQFGLHCRAADRCRTTPLDPQRVERERGVSRAVSSRTLQR